MSERLLSAITERAAIIGRGVLDAVLGPIDRHFADALNPPEVDYPRFYAEPEAPVATEEEL